MTRAAPSPRPPADAVGPGARFARVKDPEGNLIELIQLPQLVEQGPGEILA
jgi:hypothetical protein